MSLSQMAIRLAVAAACGAAIGFEREHQQKPAGLRTHMLVALGAAAFTVEALIMSSLPLNNANGLEIQIDPSRILQGVAGGIGFLGAGAIMSRSSEGIVHGLTTAATIWVVGAVGIACGAGHYYLALMTTGFAISIASVMGFVEGKLFSHKPRPPLTPEDQSATDADK